MQPVKASSNHKPETRQPKEPGQISPHSKAGPDSRSQHSFETAGFPYMESSLSSPGSVPRCKTRATNGVSMVQLPLSPATSRSPPRVRPRFRKAKANISYTSTTINLSSDNVNPAGATNVTHMRGKKRKRVVESEEDSEPTTKRPKSEPAVVERTTSPHPMGSTDKTRRNAAKENLLHKTPPTLIGANNPEALLEAEQMKPPATAKEPEVLSAKVNIIEEKAKRQPKTYSPQGSNGKFNSSESSSEIARPSPELSPVDSVLRPKNKPKASSSTSPTRRLIETGQGALPPTVPISLPDPEPNEAKVTGRYRT
jgi:hypothetical protein